MLKGYRTYLAAALLVVLAGLKATGRIDEQSYQTVLALLGALGLYGLRAAIK